MKMLGAGLDLSFFIIIIFFFNGVGGRVVVGLQCVDLLLCSALRISLRRSCRLSLASWLAFFHWHAKA
jgi:hypothetical protein